MYRVVAYKMTFFLKLHIGILIFTAYVTAISFERADTQFRPH